MRMSLIESDLKTRIEEEIREIAERRASEVIEDHLAKTAESRCVQPAPVRGVAPTLMDDDIAAELSKPPVRSVPPVAPSSPPTTLYSSPPHAHYSQPPQALYSSPPPSYSAPPASYSAPPPPYSAPPGALYSSPPPPYSAPPPPRSSYAPPSSHPSMHPASQFPAASPSAPNYIVWPDVAEPTLRGAMEAAAPRRGNGILMAVAALALCLSGAAIASATGHVGGNATASAAPVTKTVVTETANAAAPPQEDHALAAPAPTLGATTQVAPTENIPRWSRRYKGPDAQLAPAPVAAGTAAPVKPADKAASKDVKAADAPAAPAETAATPPAPPAPSMDQANKTAQLLREQLNSSVK